MLYNTYRKACRLDTGLFTILSAFEPIGIAQAAAVGEGVALLVLLVVVPHGGVTSADTLCPELLKVTLLDLSCSKSLLSPRQVTHCRARR